MSMNPKLSILLLLLTIRRSRTAPSSRRAVTRRPSRAPAIGSRNSQQGPEDRAGAKRRQREANDRRERVRDGSRRLPATGLKEIGSSVLMAKIDGEREDIVVWVQKKTGTPIITVNSLDEARRFLNKYHTFVVGFFHKFEGTEYNEFVKAAKSDKEIQIVETSDRDVAKLLFPELKTSKVFIGLVKTEAERWTLQDGEVTRVSRE